MIPREYFLNENGEFNLQVGDEVQVEVEAVEDGWGETHISRENAKRSEAWRELEVAFEQQTALKE